MSVEKDRVWIDDHAVGRQDRRWEKNRNAHCVGAGSGSGLRAVIHEDLVCGLGVCGGGVELLHECGGRLLLDALACFVGSEALAACGGGRAKIRVISQLIDSRQDVVVRLGLFLGFEVALLVIGGGRGVAELALLARCGVICVDSLDILAK